MEKQSRRLSAPARFPSRGRPAARWGACWDTISAYFYSYNYQYCYHIKQKYWIFFSPKAFCDTQTVLKRVCGQGSARIHLGELTTFPQTWLGRGHPSTISTQPASMPSASHFSESPPNFFLNTALERLTGVRHLTWIQLQRVGKEEASPKTRNSIQITNHYMPHTGPMNSTLARQLTSETEPLPAVTPYPKFYQW